MIWKELTLEHKHSFEKPTDFYYTLVVKTGNDILLSIPIGALSVSFLQCVTFRYQYSNKIIQM